MNPQAAAGDPRNFAERYETVLVPVIFEPWARELIRRAKPQDGEHILDLACGTGVVTRQLAQTALAAGSLTGADFNGDMLEVARNSAENAGIDAQWVEASADDLLFPDDAVLNKDLSQQLPGHRSTCVLHSCRDLIRGQGKLL